MMAMSNDHNINSAQTETKGTLTPPEAVAYWYKLNGTNPSPAVLDALAEPVYIFARFAPSLHDPDPMWGLISSKEYKQRLANKVSSEYLLLTPSQAVTTIKRFWDGYCFSGVSKSDADEINAALLVLGHCLPSK